MEKCFKSLVVDGKITEILSEISCSVDTQVVTEYFKWNLWIIIPLALLGLVVASMIVFPIYNVWASRKSGDAELAEANSAEQVAIAKARARLNAAEMNKEAEIVEAQAVSISINTIGKALQENDSYLRWQWIKMMDKTKNATIYVPTEANLPILEAGRSIKNK